MARVPDFGARFDFGKLNRSHRASESELHTELLGQINGKLRDHLPRIDRQLDVAPYRAEKAIRHYRVALRKRLSRREPLAGIALRRGTLAEFPSHVGLIGLIRQVKRSGWP